MASAEPRLGDAADGYGPYGQLLYGRAASILRGSKEWRDRDKSRFVLTVALVISCAATAGLVVLEFPIRAPLTVAHGAALVTALVALCCFVAIRLSTISAQRAYMDRQEDEAQQSARAQLRDVVSTPDRGEDVASRQRNEELRQRIEANDMVLKSYQDPVRRQARSSYSYAQAAAAAGFIMLVAGAIGVLLVADDSTTQLAVGGLTAIGGALSGYIAATYLRIYERAQAQQNFYFEEPLITSYLLTAERLAGQVNGDRREEVLANMVEQIVSAARSNSQGLGNPGDAPETRLKHRFLR